MADPSGGKDGVGQRGSRKYGGRGKPLQSPPNQPAHGRDVLLAVKLVRV